MEERLSYLLVRILVVSGCVVKRAKEFLAALLMPASVHQFVNESAHCILVTNGELVRVASYDRTFLFGKLYSTGLIASGIERRNFFRSSGFMPIRWEDYKTPLLRPSARIASG